jgi:uncharacterized membrane protein
MKKKNLNVKKKNDDRSGLFIPAGLFLGMGVGFLFDQLTAGMFIGMGAGFVAMTIVKVMKK